MTGIRVWLFKHVLQVKYKWRLETELMWHKSNVPVRIKIGKHCLWEMWS